MPQTRHFGVAFRTRPLLRHMIFTDDIPASFPTGYCVAINIYFSAFSKFLADIDLPRIKRIAQTIAKQIKSQHGQHDRNAGNKDQMWRIE